MGGSKVLIILNVYGMIEVVVNVLLKIFEEFINNIYLILISDSINWLMLIILSCCEK